MDEETEKSFDELFEQVEINQKLLMPWYEWVRRDMPFNLTEESTKNLMANLINVTIIQNGIIGKLTEIVGQSLVDSHKNNKDIQHLLKMSKTDSETIALLLEYLGIKY